MKTKEDFLLDVRAAIKRNQVVVMMLYNSETDEFCELYVRDGAASAYKSDAISIRLKRIPLIILNRFI